jgi:hypothetical protein
LAYPLFVEFQLAANSFWFIKFLLLVNSSLFGFPLSTNALIPYILGTEFFPITVESDMQKKWTTVVIKVSTKLEVCKYHLAKY